MFVYKTLSYFYDVNYLSKIQRFFVDLQSKVKAGAHWDIDNACSFSVNAFHDEPFFTLTY